MRYVLTITELTPAPEGDRAVTFTQSFMTMARALQEVEEAIINYTVFVNVSITALRTV